MRNQIYTGSPVEQGQRQPIPGIWSEYTPKTNLVWLLFLLKNLLNHKKPEDESMRAQSRAPLLPCPAKANGVKSVPLKLAKSISASKPVPLIAIEEQQHDPVSTFKQTLSDRLNTVLDLLDLETGREDMCCAADLVAYAIDSQWLDEKDFFLS
jgi:serine/threonine-protein kinase haspin